MGLEYLLSDTRFKTPENRVVNDGALVEILNAAFRTRSSTHWIAALRQADVPVAPGRTVGEVLGDPQFLQSEVFDFEQHPEYGEVQLVGVTPGFSGMSGIIRRPAPLLGEHTEEILLELDVIAQYPVVTSPCPHPVVNGLRAVHTPNHRTQH